MSRAGIGLLFCAALIAAGCETFRPQTDVRAEYEKNLESKPVVRNGYVELRVRPGQTLSAIAREYNTTPQAIADASGLSHPDTIMAGERVLVPVGRRTMPTPSRARPQQTAQRPGFRTPTRSDGLVVSPLGDDASRSVRAPTPRQNPIQFASLFRSEADPAATPRQKSSSEQRFDWPLEGPLLVDFGPRVSGGRSDGINIAANPGEPVKAAADGIVTYTGQIKSYGKIVLIGHADGYVTTYAHNSEIRVRKGDRVQRGQTIALAGATGHVDRPQVHFEIRRDGQAVNPRKFLVALN